jgi:hypothetical protein
MTAGGHEPRSEVPPDSADDWAGPSRRRWELSSRAKVGVVLASVLGVFVLLINLDADDRGDRLNKALVRNLTFSREVWRACAPPELAKEADDPGGYYDGRFHSFIRLNFVEVPARRWWQRLTKSQPFKGTVSVTARNSSFDCDLRVAFTAQVAWREETVHHNSSALHSTRDGWTTTVPYYDLSEVHVLNAISDPVHERLVY